MRSTTKNNNKGKEDDDTHRSCFVFFCGGLCLSVCLSLACVVNNNGILRGVIKSRLNRIMKDQGPMGGLVEIAATHDHRHAEPQQQPQIEFKWSPSSALRP
mmetsp:Transcript_9129/g.14162  ORF Transcript_9129/g.14162 Transcript_9129/m.14162 type:complete len:101 (-) Transcript_9129:300-602(-)